MSAPDRILYVHKDGSIVMHVENDGWSCPETIEYVISPEDLWLRHRWLYNIYAGGPEAAFTPEQKAEVRNTIRRIIERTEKDAIMNFGGVELDKLENAAFEAGRKAGLNEAAAMLDSEAQEYNRIRDPGMANHCRARAKRIRALVKEGQS